MVFEISEKCVKFWWNSRWNSNSFEAASEDKARVHEQNGWYPRCFFRTHDFRLQKFWHCFFWTQDGRVSFLKQFQKTRPGSMSKTVDIPDASSDFMISDSKKFDIVFFELKMEQCRFLKQFHNITNFKKSFMPAIFVAISFIFSHVTENCHSIEIILALLAMPRTWGIILCIFFWIILPPPYHAQGLWNNSIFFLLNYSAPSLPCPGLEE